MRLYTPNNAKKTDIFQGRTNYAVHNAQFFGREGRNFLSAQAGRLGAGNRRTGGFLRKTAGRMFPRPAVWQLLFRNRLGVNVDDEDDDLNIMVRSMEAIQKDLCLHLYRSLLRRRTLRGFFDKLKCPGQMAGTLFFQVTPLPPFPLSARCGGSGSGGWQTVRRCRRCRPDCSRGRRGSG